MPRTFLLLCAAIMLAAGAVRAADVTATLEPAQVAVGEAAELTVTINGSGTTAPFIPQIDGLEIEHVGQSTQVQITNGSMTASSVHTYQVVAQRAGTFTIPAIKAGDAKSQPLTLQATGGSGANRSSRTPSSALPPPGVPMPSPDAAAPKDAQYGYIQLVTPKKEFYVGELVPVDIHVLVPVETQASVGGLPTLDSDAFALNPLSRKPEQDRQRVDGRVYDVLTWHSALTAVKAGENSLGVEMPLTVVVPTKPTRRPSTGNDLIDQMFNDPFFNNSFGRGQPKEVTLRNEPLALNVQALPTANRPAGFTGAVGDFQVRASVSPTTAAAGDPLTLRLEVSGSGDFDRVKSDVLASGHGWKTYPAKSTFSADDSTGYKGTKTFEQMIMPGDASVKEVPSLRLSFFNPETRRYETRETPPIPVSITGAPVTLSAPAAAAASPAASGTPALPAAPDLVPNKVEPGRSVATLRPIFLNAWFVAAQGIPLCALAGGLAFIRRRRRLAADPALGRASAAERAIAAELAAMDRAMHAHDSAAFFLSARSALQHRLAERWNARPETITLTEVDARLNGDSDGLRPIFEMADRVSYSGHEHDEADFRHWQEVVRAQLKALKPA